MVAARKPSKTIFDALCELVQEIVPHGLATVMRLDPVDGVLVFRNAPCAPPEALDALGRLIPGPLSGACGTAVYERRLVVIEDTDSDPRWATLRETARRFNIRACWSIPIWIDENEIGGTFAISRSILGPPSEEQRDLLELLAYLGGVVLRVERAEQDADEQRSLLNAIVTGSEDPIFVKDEAGRYQLVNEAEARHRGLPQAKIIGRTDNELYASEEFEAGIEADRRVMATGESIQHEIEVVSRVDGNTRQYLVRKDPLRDAEGNVRGIVGIARDLTDRRQSERAMQQAQKLESLGVLAGGIAHDFNNLLVGIIANVTILKEDLSTASPETADSIRDIQLAATRAAELTNQLLQYAGKRTPERVQLDVADTFEELRHLLGSSLSKRVALITQFDSDLPPLHADPVQLRQVLMNLLVNASDAYEGRDGQVRIRAQTRRAFRPQGQSVPGTSRTIPNALQRFAADTAHPSSQDCPHDWIEIEVADQGAGMDAATCDRIFDPFFSTKSHGRGLGLASVLGIVSAHGGCMEVASKPGEGTTFRVWLPVEAEDSHRHARRQQPRATVQRGRVLVVEDEQTVGRALHRILDRAGYDVVWKHNGQEGSRAFTADSNGFDLAILDVLMPGLDGRELANSIRSCDKRLPIVLTSGLSELDVTTGNKSLDYDAFLAKPYTPDAVLTAIEHAKTQRSDACQS
ncbi:MAG: PAS domain-containing protein [Planctomycetota bacterium]